MHCGKTFTPPLAPKESIIDSGNVLGNGVLYLEAKALTQH